MFILKHKSSNKAVSVYNVRYCDSQPYTRVLVFLRNPWGRTEWIWDDITHYEPLDIEEID